jgi:hypothetical protein
MARPLDPLRISRSSFPGHQFATLSISGNLLRHWVGLKNKFLPVITYDLGRPDFNYLLPPVSGEPKPPFRLWRNSPSQALSPSPS